jgi:hypothetical protein
MSHLVDRAVYRLAGLWWNAIYSGLSLPAKRPTNPSSCAFASPEPMTIEHETVAA